MKNAIQGTNTGCQFNVNKTPGYNNVPFPIYGSPTNCGLLSPHFSI